MANARSQIIENAQRYAASGKIDSAIAEWTKLLSEPPQAQDGNIYNTIADLYLKKNDKDNAVNTCVRAAEVYKETGFELKGVALLKKIFKIDPDRIDIHEKLADINVERGLTGNAISGYQQTVKLYIQKGSFLAAIAVYKKLARFFPDDPEVPLSIARLHQKMEQTREATLAYEQACAIYESKNMMTDARQIIEEIVKLNPNYIKNLAKKEASVAALDNIASPKDTALSAASAQGSAVFQETPQGTEINGCDPLYALAKTNNDPNPEDLPRLSLMEAQSHPISTPVYEDPIQENNVEPTMLSSQTYYDPDVSETQVELPPHAEQHSQGEQNMPLHAPKGAVHVHKIQDTKVPDSPDVSEVIFRAHLAEVDVYLRYGLNQNAIEKLLLAKDVDPTREEPYLRLRELYAKEGQNEMAARESLALMKLYEKQGKHDKKEALMSEMRTFDPTAQKTVQETLPPKAVSYPLSGNLEKAAWSFSREEPPREPQRTASLHSRPAFPQPVMQREGTMKTAPPPPVRSVNPSSNEDAYFDLGSEMIEEFGDLTRMPPPLSPAKGPVSSARSSYDDKRQQYIETCYHLGIAHKEMGNYEKAVRELEHALAGSMGKQFQDVLLLLAFCYAESGYVAQAIEVLQGGLSDARCDADARPFVQYELASYFEQLGDKERSFAIYKEIYRASPNFKDVSGKIKEIPYRRIGPDVSSEKEKSFDAVSMDEDASVAHPRFRVGGDGIKDKRRISYV